MAKQKLTLRKIVLRVLAVVAVLVVFAGVGVFALFGHEIKTVGSIEKVDEYPLYTMNYDGDMVLTNSCSKAPAATRSLSTSWSSA